MTPSRPTPFDLVFADLAAERFPALREALEAGEVDATDRDRFLMARPVVELIRAIRPEEGVGEGMAELAALVHLAYLYWVDGGRVVGVSGDRLAVLMDEAAGASATPLGQAVYVQVPPRRIWGTPVVGAPAEPLDGWFVAPRGRALQAAAVFGLHPDRAGFSVVAVAGPRPRNLRRDDGMALFHPVLAGGASAGLYSVTGMEELLELVWRAAQLGTRP